jgi:hypothetical protein
MKKYSHQTNILLLFLILLLIFSSSVFTVCKQVKSIPGSRKDTTIKAILTGFINNDLFEDSVIIKQIARFEKFHDISIVNLWDTTDVSVNGEPLSLRIKFGNVEKEFLIHDSSYFATPMWSSDSLPIRILKKNDNDFMEWKNKIPELNSDVIVLGTEAGIDILLYWDGYKFNLYWPDEEP